MIMDDHHQQFSPNVSKSFAWGSLDKSFPSFTVTFAPNLTNNLAAS